MSIQETDSYTYLPTRLEDALKAEQKNIKSLSTVLINELHTYEEISQTYSNAELQTVGEAIWQRLVAAQFMESSHRLDSAILEILRGHIFSSFGHTRQAIEAVGYAARILQKHEGIDVVEIFVHRTDRESEFNEIFGTGHIFGKASGMNLLKPSYDFYCLGPHPNFTSQSHRIRMDQENTIFHHSFFDQGFDPEDTQKRYVAAIRAILIDHMLILRQFARTLPEELVGNTNWKSDVAQMPEPTFSD